MKGKVALLVLGVGLLATDNKCEYCNNGKSIISFEKTYEDGYTGVDHYKAGHCYIKDDSLILSCDIEVTYIDEIEKVNALCVDGG